MLFRSARAGTLERNVIQVYHRLVGILSASLAMTPDGTSAAFPQYLFAQGRKSFAGLYRRVVGSELQYLFFCQVQWHNNKVLIALKYQPYLIKISLAQVFFFDIKINVSAITEH